MNKTIEVTLPIELIERMAVDPRDESEIIIEALRMFYYPDDEMINDEMR